jgi:hypothetical protein
MGKGTFDIFGVEAPIDIHAGIHSMGDSSQFLFKATTPGIVRHASFYRGRKKKNRDNLHRGFNSREKMTMSKDLGPLSSLAGIWEGDKGADVSPETPNRSNIAKSDYRERITFEPTGRVDNHEQVLFGLRYSTVVHRIGADDPFHEEVGYWLWDAVNKQVMRSFIVPRGVTILAGGTVEADATSFSLSAESGSETYGICSNQFLVQEFKTIRYDFSLTIQDMDSFSYEQDTVLAIKGQGSLFHHTDANQLRRVEG